ncbi:ISAfe5, transposase OrfA [Yersinia pseudotuberculosis]|uniref:ISAfe5, transposase OrfA n=1 Tax=Yersinia pseudotuberculosis TaxID=633 RepID=A0A380Q3R9_YERPU|nr:ISAfe5, transposase OrfA [Yersinia pseudotuberculosis]
MKRISSERKASTLAKLLPPYNMTVAAVAQMEGISEATLYNWRNQAKTEGKPVPGADKNSKQWPAAKLSSAYEPGSAGKNPRKTKEPRRYARCPPIG